MESTKQTSGFEHLGTMATSSEDLAMNDQGETSTSDLLALADL